MMGEGRGGKGRGGEGRKGRGGEGRERGGKREEGYRLNLPTNTVYIYNAPIMQLAIICMQLMVCLYHVDMYNYVTVYQGEGMLGPYIHSPIGLNIIYI